MAVGHKATRLGGVSQLPDYRKTAFKTQRSDPGSFCIEDRRERHNHRAGTFLLGAAIGRPEIIGSMQLDEIELDTERLGRWPKFGKFTRPARVPEPSVRLLRRIAFPRK
jgi:hypothetical protein